MAWNARDAQQLDCQAKVGVLEMLLDTVQMLMRVVPSAQDLYEKLSSPDLTMKEMHQTLRVAFSSLDTDIETAKRARVQDSEVGWSYELDFRQIFINSVPCTGAPNCCSVHTTSCYPTDEGAVRLSIKIVQNFVSTRCYSKRDRHSTCLSQTATSFAKRTRTFFG